MQVSNRQSWFWNSYCFSNRQSDEDKVYWSLLLSPWEVKLRSNARRLAYKLCKEVHKDKEWWKSIKVHESGYSLKFKIFSGGDDAKPPRPRIKRLSLVGLTSANDDSLKSRLFDLISKVKFSSTAPDEDEDKSIDSLWGGLMKMATATASKF